VHSRSVRRHARRVAKIGSNLQGIRSSEGAGQGNGELPCPSPHPQRSDWTDEDAWVRTRLPVRFAFAPLLPLSFPLFPLSSIISPSIDTVLTVSSTTATTPASHTPSISHSSLPNSLEKPTFSRTTRQSKGGRSTRPHCESGSGRCRAGRSGRAGRSLRRECEFWERRKERRKERVIAVV
jgi:hypothetical protein